MPNIMFLSQFIQDITKDFRFEITKDGDLHGMGSWFDVGFREKEKEGVILSTGPSHPLTHWKQDLLMLETPIKVSKGNIFTGTISIKRNRIWRRHFNITLKLSCPALFSQEINKLYLLWR